MKNVNKETLKTAANKLMFDMSEEQYDNLLNEFDVIISQMNLIGDIEGSQMNLIGDIEGVDEVEPMTFPFDVTTTYLREDVSSKPLSREEALKNAKDVVDGQIRLPRVVK